MAFELSFSEEFFTGDDSQYIDGQMKNARKPKSIRQALVSMSTRKWKAMCADVFPGVDTDYIELETVEQQVREVNTCSDLCSPVEVWIDSEGYHTLSIHE